MIKKLIPIALLIAALLCPALSRSAPAAEAPKYGVYFHFGLQTFTGNKDIGRVPVQAYAPTGLDVRSWVQTAKRAGARFALLTAKHESGFCLWPAADYDYSVANSPVKTDVVQQFLDACRNEGIVPGIHYSVPDGHNEGSVTYKRNVPVSDAYFELMKKQITELHTKYPAIGIQEFDAAGRLSPAQFAELSQIVKKLNPRCQITVEAGNERLDPNRAWLSWIEKPDTVNKGWFWKPNPQLVNAESLYSIYSAARQKGQAFIANVGPDTTGRIPDNEVEVLMELKKLMDGTAGGSVQSTPPTQASQQQVTTVPANTGGTPAEKLKTLKQAFDQGLLSKELYDQKVKEVLDGI